MARAATASDFVSPGPPHARPFDAVGVLCDVDDADKQLHVTLVTLANDGCTFRSPVPFRPGTTYNLRIGTGPLYLASTLRIIASRDRSDGDFDVAANFV